MERSRQRRSRRSKQYHAAAACACAHCVIIVAMPWIDSHCHLDAPGVRRRPRRGAGSAPVPPAWPMLVLPAVAVAGFDAPGRAGAPPSAWPMRWASTRCTSMRADDADLERLAEALRTHRDDPHLVAVGEIGLDHFVPGLDRARQERFYAAQLKLARQPRPAGDPARAALGRRPAQAAAPHRGGRRHRPRLQRQRRAGAAVRRARLQARLRRRDDLRARAADPPPRGHPAGRGAGARDRRARHPAAVAVCEGRRARAAPAQPQRAGRAAAHRPDAGGAARLDARRRRPRSTAPTLPGRLPRLAA